jgi:hypothetical protein
MRHSAMRLLMLATSVVALMSVVATEAGAASRHVRKHHHRMNPAWDNTWHNAWDNSWASGAVRPMVRPPVGDVCPGSGRSFECKIWPPPFDQDPDRKISGSDGGG